MNYLRGLSVTAVGTGLAFGLGFANQALLARLLGTQGRGVLAAVTTTVLVATMLLGEWINRGNTYVAGHDPRRAPVLLTHTILWPGLMALLLALVLGWTGEELAARLQAGGGDVAQALNEPLLWATGGLVAVLLLQRGAQAVLLGLDRLTLYNLIPVLFIALFLGGNVAHALAGDLQLMQVMISWCLAAALSGGVAVIACGRPAARLQAALLVDTARVGSRGALAGILVLLLFRADIYLVGWFLGAERLGVYAIAVVIAEMVQRLPNIAGTVLLPKVMAGADDDHDLSLRVSRATLWLSVSIAAAILLAGRPFILAVFSADYLGAYEPLCLMLPGLVASGFGSILNTKLAAQGYPAVTVWAPALALTVNIGLNLWWIPSWGLAGAAVATSTAYILWGLCVAAVYRRRTDLPWGGFLRFDFHPCSCARRRPGRDA